VREERRREKRGGESVREKNWERGREIGKHGGEKK